MVNVDPLQLVAVIGFVIIAVFSVIEYRRWHQIGSIIGRRQRALRVVLMICIEIFFVLVYLGPIVIGLQNTIKSLIYYSVCMIVGLVVVVLALLDLIAISRGYRTMNRRLFGDVRKDDLQDK